jgi:peptide/nickel transport system substrate-binding protein
VLAAVGLLLTTLAAGAAPQDQTIDRSSILRIANSNQVHDPSNLNIYAPSVSRSDTGIHQLVYEYFFYYNLQTGEFIPWLAENYKYNSDFTALDVKLRDGVTWSDGQPFNADDVTFTYDLLKHNPGMTWAAETNQNVDSVEKLDNLDVRFHLKMPNPHFHLIREAFPAVGVWGGITILPKHIWQGKDPLTFKASPPIGTGPYTLQNATSTSFTYVRNDNWWGNKVFGVLPAPKEVQFVYQGSETSAALALSSNDIDVSKAGTLRVGSFLSVAQRNPSISAWSNSAPYAWFAPCPRALMVQSAHPPLDDPQVRWAISYAIDRDALVELAYGGATVPSWGIWPFYDPNQPYFDAISDLRAQYPSDRFSPDQTSSLLSAAGVNPSDITLDYVVDYQTNEDMKVAQVVSDQLRAAGFNVEVTPLTHDVLDDALRRGDYDIALNAFCPGYITENLDLFNSKNYVPPGQPAPTAERNSFRYVNSDYDAIVNQLFTTDPADMARLTSLYHDAMAIWLHDLPVIPLTQAPALVPFNSTYWQNWPSADNAWNTPVPSWATFDLVLTGYPKPGGGWAPGIKPR